MIQRIQTIYFILAALCFGAMFFLPMAISAVATQGFFTDQAYRVTDHPALLAETVLGIALALVSVFLYSNRSLQFKLGYAVIGVAIALPVCSFLLLSGSGAGVEQTSGVQNQAGLFIPFGAIIFTILAMVRIRKDEQLVKSMDRLR